MKTLFASIVMVLFFQVNECTTTFEVTDCDGEPVLGATIIIEICEGEEIGQITDINGKASFKVCSKDICKVRLSFIGYAEYTNTKIGDDCTIDKDGNAICKLKICD